MSETGYVFRTGPRVGPGRLVAVDGFDGSGKSTLVRRLTALLTTQGRTALSVRTPTASFKRSRMFVQLAKRGRDDLIDPLALQVAHTADRLQLARRTIVPELLNGTDVVVDRYLVGAYGGLIHWDVLPAPWFHDLIGRLPTPHVAVYLQVTYERWAERMATRVPAQRTDCGREEYEKRVAAGLEIAKRNKMLILNTTERSIAECAEAVLRALEEQ